MEQTFSMNLPVHTIITLGFYLAAIIYILFTTVMYYHWNEYSIDDGVTRTTLVLYFTSTIPLMLTLGFLALVI